MELDGGKEKDGGGAIVDPAKCVLLFKLLKIININIFEYVRNRFLTMYKRSAVFQKNIRNVSLAFLVGKHAAALPNVGNCSGIEFYCAYRNCTSSLYRGLRTDPTGNFS